MKFLSTSKNNMTIIINNRYLAKVEKCSELNNKMKNERFLFTLREGQDEEIFHINPLPNPLL